MARRGARVVGIDNSPKQLETATRLQREHGLDFPLLLGNAEQVPYPDASFDFAISEYGAALWADPYAWVPEAARLLRPGGRLMMLTNGLLAYLTVPDIETDGPADERLKRPLFGMHRTVWPDEPDAVEFHLAHGDWIRLFRASGFEVEDLVELRAPEGATTRYQWMDPAWAASGRARRPGRSASPAERARGAAVDRPPDLPVRHASPRRAAGRPSEAGSMVRSDLPWTGSGAHHPSRRPSHPAGDPHDR